MRPRPTHRRARVHRPVSPLALSLTDAAQALGIGSTKLGQLVASGELPTVSIGRRRLVLAEDLTAYVVALRKQQRGRIALSEVAAS